MSSLHNKKVLVTREITQAKSLANLIESYNGIPVVVPLITIKCIKDIEVNFSDKRYEWILFTSVNGVRCFMEQYRHYKQIADMKIAVVGHKTAKIIKQYGYNVHFIPSTYNAETMVVQFLKQYPFANHFLIVRGNLSRDVLLQAFAAKNLSFDSVIVYESKPNLQIKEKLLDIIENEQLDYLTFTSPSTVKTFVQMLKESVLLDEVRQLPTVCIGTTTENEAKSHQFTSTSTPKTFTIEGMVQQLIKFENN